MYWTEEQINWSSDPQIHLNSTKGTLGFTIRGNVFAKSSCLRWGPSHHRLNSFSTWSYTVVQEKVVYLLILINAYWHQPGFYKTIDQCNHPFLKFSHWVDLHRNTSWTHTYCFNPAEIYHVQPSWPDYSKYNNTITVYVFGSNNQRNSDIILTFSRGKDNFWNGKERKN